MRSTRILDNIRKLSAHIYTDGAIGYRTARPQIQPLDSEYSDLCTSVSTNEGY